MNKKYRNIKTIIFKTFRPFEYIYIFLYSCYESPLQQESWVGMDGFAVSTSVVYFISLTNLQWRLLLFSMVCQGRCGLKDETNGRLKWLKTRNYFIVGLKYQYMIKILSIKTAKVYVFACRKQQGRSQHVYYRREKYCVTHWQTLINPFHHITDDGKKDYVNSQFYLW